MSGQPAILVTGGAGYIGGHILLAMAAAGRTCIVIDDLSGGQATRVCAPHRLVVGDVADRDLVARTVREHDIRTVVHLAGFIDAPASVGDPLPYYRNNAGNTALLLEACVAEGVRHMVFSSTATVYGEQDVPLLDETLPLDPVSPYGASKAMAERIIHDAAAAHGLTFAILRYFNVAGADADMRCGPNAHGTRHLISVLCDTVLGRRDSVSVFGTDYPTPDGTCLRDYIHVSDLADVHRLMVERLEAGLETGVFNCGYGRGVSVRDMAAAMQDLTGAALDIRNAPRRAGDPPSLVADIGRLTRLTGWQPARADLRTILSSALQWERVRETGGDPSI